MEEPTQVRLAALSAAMRLAEQHAGHAPFVVETVIGAAEKLAAFLMGGAK